MTEEIYKLLDDRRVKEAVASLKAAAAELEDWQLASRVETLGTNYGYMLKYVSMGIQDPNMQEVYNKMLGEAYLCADRCKYILHSRKYPELYRPFARRKRSLKEIFEEMDPLDHENMDKHGGYYAVDYPEKGRREDYQRFQDLMDEMFDGICFSTEWTQEDFDAASEYLCHNINFTAIIVMTGALTVNLLHYFDPLKFAMLICIVTHENSEENNVYSTFAAFILICLIHDKRIQLHKSTLKPLLNEMQNFVRGEHRPLIDRMALTVQELLLTSINTDKIVKKINEEVLPEMMQTMMTDPGRIQRIISGEEDFSESEKDRKEWQKKADKVNEKMQKLVGMHNKGADTYYSSFRNLKGYSFFRHPAHWFYDYNDYYPEIGDIVIKLNPSKGSILYELLESESFCDSDKFSFLLTLKDLPPNQLRILLNTDTKNMAVAGLPEFFIWEKNNYLPKNFIRNFFQVLYRFIKLWRPGQLNDPFKMKFEFHNCTTLSKWFDRPQAVKNVAETWLFWECFKESAEAWDVLLNRYEGFTFNFEMNKSAGIAYEKSGVPMVAALYYGRALKENPDDIWLNKRILDIQLHLEQYLWALDTFKKLIQLEPDNMDTLYSLSMTLIKVGKFNEALNTLFKIDYISGYSAPVTRAIGWCYLMTADFDKADSCFRKIIDLGQENAADLMNLGHAHYFRYDLVEAYKWYKASYDKMDNKKKFYKSFKQDMWTFKTVAEYEVVDPMLNSLILDSLKTGQTT